MRRQCYEAVGSGESGEIKATQHRRKDKGEGRANRDREPRVGGREGGQRAEEPTLSALSATHSLRTPTHWGPSLSLILIARERKIRRKKERKKEQARGAGV